MTEWRLNLLSIILVIVVGFILIAQFRAAFQTPLEARRAEAREREEQVIRSEGIQVVGSGDPTELEEQLAQENLDLRNQLAELRKVRPAKPVRVSDQSTGPVIVVAPPAPPRSSEWPCTLYSGDGLELQVHEVELESAGGARSVVGEARALRLTDGELLASGRFAQPLGRVIEPITRRPGWALGVRGTLRLDGQWTVGIQMSPPPFLEHLEMHLGAGLGRGADVSLAVLWRW
jgi:hypothetical protein